ncbi:hypothetical protein Tco_0268649 [Tanacetum coccineum]
MASMNTRLNIEKLDGNIVQKHGGSKQVGFKQLGPGVETGVHGVHDEKRVWFEVELQRAQGYHEAEVFQASNDDTVVAQRRLEDKQPEEKTNTDCLVKEQEKEYQTGWKIKTGNVLDSCNQRSTQQCMKSGVAKHLGVAGIQQHKWGWFKETNVTLLAKVCCFLIQSGLSKVLLAEDTTMSTYLVNKGCLNRLRSSAYSWDTVKGIVGNKLWRLDDVTSKVVLYRNMGFNKSGEYKKLSIGSCLGTRFNTVYARSEFEVEPQDARDREQHSVRELYSKEKTYEAAFAVAVLLDRKMKWMLDQICMCSAMVTRNVVTTAMAITERLHQGLGRRKTMAKGTLAESGYELSLVAGIATGALVKGAAYRY